MRVTLLFKEVITPIGLRFALQTEHETRETDMERHFATILFSLFALCRSVPVELRVPQFTIVNDRPIIGMTV